VSAETTGGLSGEVVLAVSWRAVPADREQVEKERFAARENTLRIENIAEERLRESDEQRRLFEQLDRLERKIDLLRERLEGHQETSGTPFRKVWMRLSESRAVLRLDAGEDEDLPGEGLVALALLLPGDPSPVELLARAGGRQELPGGLLAVNLDFEVVGAGDRDRLARMLFQLERRSRSVKQ